MLAATTCLLLAAAVPTARASTVSLSGLTVTLTAQPGETNRVDINLSEEIEDLAGITPGPGCTALSPTKVQCGISEDEYGTNINWDTFVLALGDGDDVYESSELTLSRVTIDAGPGNDQLRGIDANEVATIDAGAGNDIVTSGNGNDSLLGGPGDDTIEGDRGNDMIDGGPGRDTLVGDSTTDTLAHGNDTIQARDGETDSVSCQFGADSVTADAADVVEALTCESVSVPAGDPGPGGPATQPPGTPAPQSRVPATCRRLSGKRRTTCVKRAKAVKRCRAMKSGTRKAKRRKAACLRKAKRIGKARASLAIVVAVPTARD
jgi:RTX calcium-binding nonapeptide repeat (4 copies)